MGATLPLGGRVLSSDPGFALLMPTAESAAVAALVAARTLNEAVTADAGIAKAKGAAAAAAAANLDADYDFEHAAFNEAIFLPSHGGYVAPGVMRRTLNYLCFANSKAVFRFLRKDRRYGDRKVHAPVAVRLSYHRGEPDRLEDVYVNYLEGNAGGAVHSTHHSPIWSIRPFADALLLVHFRPFGPFVHWLTH